MESSSIKIPKLKGADNWDIWHLRMESLLIEKGYYDIMHPKDLSSLDDKERLERIALS